MRTGSKIAELSLAAFFYAILPAVAAALLFHPAAKPCNFDAK
jgi:hypothetical protein